MLCNLDADIFLSFISGGSEVRCERNVFFLGKKNMIRCRGFIFKDVKSTASYMTRIDSGLEGWLINESAASAVDDQGALVHQSESFAVNDVARVVGKWHV